MGDEKLARPHILAAEEQNAAGGQAVPAGTTCLLIVALQIFWHVVVDHIPDIGLVNAHTKGIGGHHDQRAVIEKVLLIPLALFRFQPRVVPGGGDAPLSEQGTDLLHGLSGGAVDDAAFPWTAPDQLQQGGALVRWLANFEIQVFPVEAGGDSQRIPEGEQAGDVLLNLRRGSGREGAHRPQ